MRFAFLAPLLALPACGLYDDSVSAEGSSAGAGYGGAGALLPSVECAPKGLRAQTGELVPPSSLTSRGVAAEGCDPSSPGDVQYAWTAPAAGCYRISTLTLVSGLPPAKNTLKVTRDTCEGAPVLCSVDNYGYDGLIGPFAEGARLVIAFTKIPAKASGDTHELRIFGPLNCN